MKALMMLKTGAMEVIPLMMSGTVSTICFDDNMFNTITYIIDRILIIIRYKIVLHYLNVIKNKFGIDYIELYLQI